MSRCVLAEAHPGVIEQIGDQMGLQPGIAFDDVEALQNVRGGVRRAFQGRSPSPGWR